MRVKYRKFRFLDSFRLAYLLANEWDLGYKGTLLPKLICGLRYLFLSLEYSNIRYVAVHKSKVLGIICIKYTNNKSNIIYHILSNLCTKNIFWDKTKEFSLYDSNYSEIEEKCDKISDTVLDLLIVDKSYRGYGIGKKFLKLALLKTKISLSVTTDTSCNYQFYLSNGFDIVESKILNAETGAEGEIDYLLIRRKYV